MIPARPLVAGTAVVAAAIGLTACHRADPELEAQARSLVAWDAGKAALDAGRFADARAKFEEADAAHPSPLLGAWQAKALADGGDLDGAVALLARVLSRSPTFAEARYNRAAYLVRLGRIDEAARELDQALQDGELRGLQVLEDPDFATVLDHPAFQFLPRSALTVVVEAPPPTAFWGAEVAVKMRVLGIVTAPVSVTAGQTAGPMAAVSVIEDTTPTTLGSPAHEIAWTWRVTGGGEIVVGPFSVTAGGHTATADAVRVVAMAPEGRTAQGSPAPLAAPSAVIDRVAPRSSAVRDGQLVVRAQPTDRVRIDPPLGAPVRFERRERGQPVDVALTWPLPPPGAPVATVHIDDASGAEVYAGPVRP